MQDLGLLLAVTLLGTGGLLNAAVLVYVLLRARQAALPQRKLHGTRQATFIPLP